MGVGERGEPTAWGGSDCTCSVCPWGVWAAPVLCGDLVGAEVQGRLLGTLSLGGPPGLGLREAPGDAVHLLEGHGLGGRGRACLHTARAPPHPGAGACPSLAPPPPGPSYGGPAPCPWAAETPQCMVCGCGVWVCGCTDVGCGMCRCVGVVWVWGAGVRLRGAGCGVRGVRVWGMRFGVWVLGAGCTVWGLGVGCRVRGAWMWGVGCMVQGPGAGCGVRVRGPPCTAQRLCNFTDIRLSGREAGATDLTRSRGRQAGRQYRD